MVESFGFTTSPKGHKRKAHSPIRQRCLEFLEILKGYGYTRTIPEDEAKELFMAEMGIFDRKSIENYFGRHECKVRQSMVRYARYGSGCSGVKCIELTHDVTKRKGL